MRSRLLQALLIRTLIFGAMVGIPVGPFTYGIIPTTLIVAAGAFALVVLCSLIPDHLHRCDHCGGNSFWCNCED